MHSPFVFSFAIIIFAIIIFAILIFAILIFAILIFAIIILLPALRPLELPSLNQQFIISIMPEVRSFSG